MGLAKLLIKATWKSQRYVWLSNSSRKLNGHAKQTPKLRGLAKTRRRRRANVEKIQTGIALIGSAWLANTLLSPPEGWTGCQDLHSLSKPKDWELSLSEVKVGLQVAKGKIWIEACVGKRYRRVQISIFKSIHFVGFEIDLDEGRAEDGRVNGIAERTDEFSDGRSKSKIGRPGLHPVGCYTWYITYILFGSCHAWKCIYPAWPCSMDLGYQKGQLVH